MFYKKLKGTFKIIITQGVFQLLQNVYLNAFKRGKNLKPLSQTEYLTKKTLPLPRQTFVSANFIIDYDGTTIST